MLRGKMFGALTLSVLSCLAPVARADVHELIVGTFGPQALYTLSFDDQSYELKLEKNTTVSYASAWIAFSHDKKNLYGTAWLAVPPVFVSYALENATSIVEQSVIPAGGNCTGTSAYVVADPLPPYAVYGSFFYNISGCGAVISVDPTTGALAASLQNFSYYSESGVHGLALSPGSDYLYSADDSGNSLWTHRINRTTGEVAEVNVQGGPSTGSDPRHVAVHPDGQYVYVILEGSSQLAVYTVADADAESSETDATAGVPTQMMGLYPLLLATSPEGGAAENPADYWADEVALSASGTYLWATNRAFADAGTPGYISVFTLNSSGAVMGQNFLVPTMSTGGFANSVAPSPFSDSFVALTDSQVGFVEIWELAANGSSAAPIAHLDLEDGGCCANAVWYS